MSHLDVRGAYGAYAVFDGEDRKSQFYRDYRQAVARSERLVQEQGHRDRACMCCGATFRSEGFHNRLCNDCRRLSE